MPDIGSNQYPRLPWEREDDPAGRPSFAAWPHGHEGGKARVWYAGERPKWSQWAWIVSWTGRFTAEGGAAGKQAAADEATIAYWDMMERTEGWKPPPPPPPPPPEDLMKTMYMRRFRAWVERASKDDVRAQLQRFMHACVAGPTIISKEMDREMWNQLALAFYFYDSRSYPP